MESSTFKTECHSYLAKISNSFSEEIYYAIESLSLQLHNHRSEHWVVVSGKALIEIEGEKKLLNKNESAYIPLGSKHRLSNPGNSPLILIEVQSGDYFGEDDIIRFQDKYGR